MPAPIGLDITPTALVAVSVKKKGRTYSVDRHAEYALSTGLVSDGEVTDVDGLSAAIRAFWDEEKFPGKTVAIGVANQRSVTRMVELPKIRQAKQLKDALSFEIADHLPIPLDEAVWDFHTVEEVKDPETGNVKQRHLVVAVYRESVERYREAVEGAGLKLARIDLSAFALMRTAKGLVPEVDPEHRPVIALCDLGATATNLVVSQGDVCRFNRQVPFGAAAFAQTLAEQFGWSVGDAERVSRDAGVLPAGGVEAEGDPYADSRHVMQYVTDLFAHELRNAFDYLGNAVHGVDHIVLSGTGALYRGIDQHLAGAIGIPVTLLDAGHKLDAGSVERLGPHSHYGVALGLAMEDAA